MTTQERCHQNNWPRSGHSPRFSLCYNHRMPHKDPYSAYRARWRAVEAFQKAERKAASLELRWRQLNAAYGLAIGLGLLRPVPSEIGIFERWSQLKEKLISQSPQT